MTYEEVIEKIRSTTKVSVVSVKDIQHGKSITLSNGSIINCFNTGKHNVQGRNTDETKAILGETAKLGNRKIFVVYGHDDIARTQLEALLRRWDLEPIILDQQASGGQTIIEKLEEYSQEVGYAIVLATPDDEGKSKSEDSYKSRVRQNVVLELGMFLAKLGREKVAILLKEDIEFEKPSDIHGLIYIPFDKKVALVGASGSGKSTIAKLLLKYYEPEAGDITIDGMDISEYKNDDIRHAISYVPQNIELFSKSIYDNIRVTRQSATLDEVKEAAKAADAHEFIKRLPMQYYTYLEEAGNGLSGGEKQRIALARAFLKENQFYIMDESTSNLDFATENIIFDMIYNKFRKKTMLIIAHRLATVKNCDKIIVMDKGKIVEQGTHQQLLERKEQYYRLWEMQQGNFVIKEDSDKDEQFAENFENDDEGVMSYT